MIKAKSLELIQKSLMASIAELEGLPEMFLSKGEYKKIKRGLISALAEVTMEININSQIADSQERRGEWILRKKNS